MVISILGLLIGILTPVLTRARQVAVKTACASNLRQIGTIVTVYQSDHGERFPMARYMPAPFLTGFPDDPGLPFALVDHLPEDSGVYRCPGDDGHVHELTGISYTYNASLSGRTLDKTWFARRLRMQASQTPVSYDTDGNTFELQDGTQVTAPTFHLLRNLLFADAHVGNYQ